MQEQQNYGFKGQLPHYANLVNNENHNQYYQQYPSQQQQL